MQGVAQEPKPLAPHGGSAQYLPAPLLAAGKILLHMTERITQLPLVVAMQRSLVLVLPIIIAGAMALMVQTLPIPGFQEFLTSLFGPAWSEACDTIVTGTFGIVSLALLCAFGGAMAVVYNQRAASYARRRHSESAVSPIMASIVVLACFFVLVAPADPAQWGALFHMREGMLPALLVAILGSSLFLFLARMRSLHVPLRTVGSDPIVRDVLADTPAAVVTIGIFAIARLTLSLLGVADLTLSLQHHIVALLDTADMGLGWALLYSGLSQVLWIFGTPGPNLLAPAELTMTLASSAQTSLGGAVAQYPEMIFTKSFFDAFTRMGGSGGTLSLIFAVFLCSRHRGNVRLCLFALFPSLCNVNEPLLFGIPLVLNPVYALPFLLTPLVQTFTAYYATLFGLVPLAQSSVAWTTPVFLSGYAATNSVAGVGMQIVNLLLGFALYLPFVRLADVLQERQGRGILHSLLRVAEREQFIPTGRRCLDRPGNEGRVAKALANDLEQALLKRTQIYLEYQPQLAATGARVYGVEALLRWRHPIYGLVPPPLIVTLAEELGNIGKLGEFVLHEACAQRALWRQQMVPAEVTISVNVSPSQLLDARFARKVMEILFVHGLPPAMLELEITETTAFTRRMRAMETLRQLRSQGVRVAIDDFGMGHTSLRYLQEFPVDTVKIDRSLSQAPPSNVNEHIVRSIVELSRTLNIATVVEGVETTQQLDRFVALGCDIFQGYLFSRPLPGDTCLAFILDRAKQ